MSASAVIRRNVAAAMLAFAISATGGAHARDWADLATTPFADPLLAGPPRLDAGRLLPGDMQAHVCEGGHDGAAPLTLSQAVDLALCHNPRVQSAWAAIKVQAAQLGEARSAYLPTVTVGVSELRQKTRYPDSRVLADTERKSRTQYATLTWRLLDCGGRGANRRSAGALLDAALASHDAVLQETLSNVIGAYFDAQTAKANREAKEKGMALAQQTWETARKREARGAGAQSDTLQAKMALAKAELESGRALGGYERALAVLGVALGLPAEMLGTPDSLTLAQDYLDTEDTLRQDLADWLALAQDQHPALVAAGAQVESARERLTVTRSEGLPTLDFTQSRYLNGRPSQGLSATRTEESVIGFTVNFPLFEGFGRTYKVRGAQAQIEVKEAELRDTRNRVLGEVVKAHADAVAALRNLGASARLIDASQDALDNVQRKYDRGIVDILEMLSVQRAQADAVQERVRALSEWRSARLRLLASAGTVSLEHLHARR
ncbi:TolC family protein [Cupriavidus sp. WS]|uniref:TolC family protein n=1 Tax=Cupriavidus sp. WS TaxID=1312922 RepID=UPI00036E6D25|nr:TolC family protein [Cupriavidus sp. WS]